MLDFRLSSRRSSSVHDQSLHPLQFSTDRSHILFTLALTTHEQQQISLRTTTLDFHLVVEIFVGTGGILFILALTNHEQHQISLDLRLRTTTHYNKDCLTLVSSSRRSSSVHVRSVSALTNHEQHHISLDLRLRTTTHYNKDSLTSVSSSRRSSSVHDQLQRYYSYVGSVSALTNHEQHQISLKLRLRTTTHYNKDCLTLVSSSRRSSSVPEE